MLLAIIVVLVVWYLCSGSQTLGIILAGIIKAIVPMAIGIAVIGGAFAANPILGIIVLYFVIKIWQSIYRD